MKELGLLALPWAMQRGATGLGRAAIQLLPAVTRNLFARSRHDPTIAMVVRDLAPRRHLAVADGGHAGALAKLSRLHCTWSVDGDGRLACRWRADCAPAPFSGGNERLPPDTCLKFPSVQAA